MSTSSGRSCLKVILDRTDPSYTKARGERNLLPDPGGGTGRTCGQKNKAYRGWGNMHLADLIISECAELLRVYSIGITPSVDRPTRFDEYLIMA